MSSSPPPTTSESPPDAGATGVRAALDPWLRAALTFVVFRGALLAFDYVGLSLVPRLGTCRPQWEVFGPGHDFWNGFFRWDSGWYRNIVLNGYTYKAEHASSVAFYPLFPYLSRWLGAVIGSPFAAGLLISGASTIAAIHYMRRIGELLFPRETTERAVALLLVFPTSFFLSAFYTEALFLALAAASTYLFLRERYVVSGLLGGLSMLTRSSGMALFLALAADLVLRLLQRKMRFRWTMLGLLLVPAGLGAFMWILKVQVGDPFAFAKVMTYWGRERAWPWVPLIAALGKLDAGFPEGFEAAQSVIDAAFGLGFLGMGTAMVHRRYPVALSALVLVGVLIPLSTANLTSMGRYVLVLFPAFYWLADVTTKRPTLERIVFFGSAFFLAIYSLRFMRCGWAG